MFPVEIRVFIAMGQVFTLDLRRLAVAKLIEQVMGVDLMIHVTVVSNLQLVYCNGMPTTSDSEIRRKIKNQHMGLKAMIGDFQLGATAGITQPELLLLVNTYLEAVQAEPHIITQQMIHRESLRTAFF